MWLILTVLTAPSENPIMEKLSIDEVSFYLRQKPIPEEAIETLACKSNVVI